MNTDKKNKDKDIWIVSTLGLYKSTHHTMLTYTTKTITLYMYYILYTNSVDYKNSMCKMKVSINRNGLLFKKITFKILNGYDRFQ